MAYTNSPLASYTRISPNRTLNRNHAIDTVSIHCVVGQSSVETLGAVFASPSRQASANYGIGADGRIGLYVEEKDRSWCTSSASNDNRAVTIEVASDTTHPYAVRDVVYQSLINLLVDVCKRNGIKKLLWQGNKSLIGQVDKQNMTVHRWFASKACPGDYLYNLHGQIAAEVNARLVTVVNAAIQPNTGEKCQRLIFEKAGDGLYRIKDKEHGYYLTAASAVNDGNVDFRPATGKNDQIWKEGKVKKSHADYTCYCPANNLKEYLSVDNNGHGSSNLKLWTALNNTKQYFWPRQESDGSVLLVHTYTGKCVSAKK